MNDGDSGTPPAPETASAATPTGGSGVLGYALPLLNGKPQDLAEYEGDVVLVVNTATECGFTPQFKGLERLWDERRREGLTVLGFPANDFAGQEPRSNKEIGEFCEDNYGVSFPIFAKTVVTGDDANDFFKALSAEVGEPTWNFNKYLIDREGQVVTRFEVKTKPQDPAFVEAIDRLLAA